MVTISYHENICNHINKGYTIILLVFNKKRETVFMKSYRLNKRPI